MNDNGSTDLFLCNFAKTRPALNVRMLETLMR